ncbi:MAG TPA: SAM-dependent methyltransferase [Casimicrobiaceae bacterium]
MTDAQHAMTGAERRGTLYAVPNLLGAVPPDDVLPRRTLDVARGLRDWVVETPKAARAFFATLGMPVPIAELAITPLADLRDGAALAAALEPARHGRDIGLLSDAGCPGVADPGAALVAAAHAAKLRVVPLVGPSAILLALMAAGLDGQRFAFHGYLPAPAAARTAALRELEARSRARRETQVFIETPYRNAAMIGALAQALAPATIVCVAANLTLPDEEILRAGAASWRRVDARRFDRRPAIFLLLAS